VLHLDELGTLSKDMLNINETAHELPLRISFAPLGKGAHVISREHMYNIKRTHSVQVMELLLGFPSPV
jgi:hypothetical protein